VERSRNWIRLEVSLISALVLSAAFAAAPAEAQIPKDQRLCINTMEKELTLIDKQASRQVATCLKNHAKERALSPNPFIDTVDECLRDDPRGKIFASWSHAEANYTRRCVPALPPFGPTDLWDLVGASYGTSQTLTRSIWTENDLDQNLILERIDKRASLCQQKAWRSVSKCKQARLKEFGRCARKGLMGSAVPGLIDSAADMQNLCLGTGTNPQPDAKKKVARACSDPKRGIQKVIDKSCTGLNVGLTQLFPTCGSGTAAATARCLDRKAACVACMTLNGANALDRDCELFDDGLANDSCACGNGVLNAGEQCDDGNNAGGDGCSFDCRNEIG
jgi:cysteine-rich repeat protein